MTTDPQADNHVLQLIERQTARALEVYRADPGQVEEHANSERRIEQGGYGDRQVFELVQNAADELRDDPDGEIAVVLTSSTLYCANRGNPVTAEGAETILRMSVSRKRGGQIGRFGVGVKSVLAICDAPEFFSFHGEEAFAFGFDRQWSERTIRAAIDTDAPHTPVLRMARVLEADDERTDDPVLDELMTWAVTVVRLRLKDGVADRLARDLRSFPVEFPLFSPHVKTLSLIDRRGQRVTREIFLRRSGATSTIEEHRPDGTSVQHRWQVFSREHRPGESALRSAGELHDRPAVDVSWAVPPSTQARGQLWSYFPTKLPTLLRGVLNAPWKTSEDRQAIFDGNAFNDELVAVAAELVIDSLARLVRDDDPGSYLAFLPGRGREAPNFLDEKLTETIWRTAGRKPSIADQDGHLRRPDEVRLHPEGLDRTVLDPWAQCPHRPSDWAHPSLEARDRRSRVELIYASAGVETRSVTEWLEALVGSREPAASRAAVCIVARLVESGHSAAPEALEAKVVLREDGALLPPAPGTVFLRSETGVVADGLAYVDSRVLDGFGVGSAFQTLRINEADAKGRLAAAVDRGFAQYRDDDWDRFWELVRQAGAADAIETLTKDRKVRQEVRAKVVSGPFRPISEILRPGRVVPADGSRDGLIALDTRFHSGDLGILSELGLVEGAVSPVDPSAESWFDDYREAMWKLYMRNLPPDARRPQLATMQIQGTPPAGPLRMLQRLSPEGSAAFLESLPDAGVVRSWTIQPGRQQQSRRQCVSPLAWMARRHGRLRSSLGTARTTECVGPALRAFDDLLPVARVSELVGDALRLPSTLDAVGDDLWRQAVERLRDPSRHTEPARLYALMIRHEATWPDDTDTWCRVGDDWSQRADTEIAVTAAQDDYDELVRAGVPSLLAESEDDVTLLVETWTMKRASTLITKELRVVPQAAPEVILDLFPGLKDRRQRVEGWSVQRCDGLERLVHSPQGVTASPLARASRDQTVFVLDPDDDLTTLRAVDAELSLGLGPDQCQTVIENQARRARSKKAQEIRRTTSTPEKLVRLLGEDVLRGRLPRGLEESERRRRGRRLTPVEVGQLAVDAHGYGVLRVHSQDVADRADDAPRSFSGTESARRFVAELGLPDQFAGTSIPAPPVTEIVAGPSRYPRLHDYQETLAARTRDFLMSSTPGRALLCLPTGAGKTRVAVEAVIRVAKERGLEGPILWIAESSELCEQAVQSWKFVWSAVGPGRELTVSRFWSSNDVFRGSENPQLVVATDAKLRQQLGRDDLDWLRRPAVVIVDEAHRAIAPTYTRLLELLGLSLRARRTERPLVGLTATPFRGRNEPETRRLIDRFGGLRLDEGLFGDDGPTAALQRLGVLARVDHREIPGGTMTLTDEQKAHAATMGTLPSTAEAELGRDEARNDTLVKEIVGLPRTWSVLVFAVSVEHAKLLAASLNARGVKAASIDASTPAGQRAQTIEAYRRGTIRVLTNWGVLAQGFDAPATRAVVVARPAFSPNVYQQMIGRGLRGPENGGSEECLILDVGDNFENFDGQLIWSEFEHLWSEDR